MPCVLTRVCVVQTETRDAALRAKASLERALRITQSYADALAGMYGRPAGDIGRGLGMPDHMYKVFAGAF